MTVDGVPGRVTICSSGRSGLFADDAGVTVRDFPGRPRRFAWSEVSRFTDRCVDGDSGKWVLEIVMHTGRRLRPSCTAGSFSPELLTVIGEVAERYGITTELSGLPMSAGRPAEDGLYEDPGGLPGLRYWDGTLWSPLLPISATGKGWSAETVRKSAERWAELPVAPGPWRYPAIKAARCKVWFGVWTVVTATLLAGGVIPAPWLAGWWNGPGATIVVIAGFMALCIVGAWVQWSSWKALAKAASESVDAAN